MIALSICFVFLFVLLLINKKYIKFDYKILNPVSLIIYVWLLVFICHYYYWPNSDGYIYLITTLGIISLSIGFWISTPSYVNISSSIARKEYNPRFIKKCLQILVLLEIVRLCFYSYVIVYKLAGGNWFLLLNEGSALRGDYLKYEDSIVEKIFGFSSNLLAYIGYVILGINVACNKINRWRYLLLISIIELALAVVTMSKLSFSLYILAILISYLNSLPNISVQRKQLKRMAPIGLAFLIAFFFFIGFQRNYMETRDSLMSGVIDGFISYFGGGLEAFRIILEKGTSIMSQNDGMVDIGMSETNVYTWFFYFYQHLSYFGIVLFPFIIGLLAGKFYKPWAHNFFYDISNSWICIIFSFSFFDLLLKFTVFQFLFIFVWYINKRWHKKINIRC